MEITDETRSIILLPERFIILARKFSPARRNQSACSFRIER